MSTMYSARQHSDRASSWPARELARLLFHWLIAGAALALIGSLFLLTQFAPGEAAPILLSAFAILGIGIAGLCLWALAVGESKVRHSFYGPLPQWLRQRTETMPGPWFDHTGAMLWQRDEGGGWVRKLDPASEMAVPTGQEPTGT